MKFIILLQVKKLNITAKKIMEKQEENSDIIQNKLTIDNYREIAKPLMAINLTKPPLFK